MECEQFCQDFIDTFTDPIMVIENGCRVVMVNNALLSLHGEQRADVIGRSCYQILHHTDSPCDLPHGECPYLEVFEKGKPVKVTHRHYTAQNEELTIEVTASPLRNENGGVARMVEVMRDLTRERRLKEQTRQSYEFLESVLEGIGEGVVVVDREYRILSANKGYVRQLGQEGKHVVGKHCYEISHHFDSHCMDNGHHCPVRDTFESGRPSRTMHTHYDHDGGEVFVECQSYPVRNAAGEVVRAIETVHDVTERVQLEHKVRESEEKYRDLYDNAPDGYFSVDEKGVFVEMNRTFPDMLGYRRDEVLRAMQFRDVIAKESGINCEKMFSELKGDVRIRNMELMLLRKDGSLLPVMMNATAVFSADGRFVMTRSVVRDITENKKMDEEKRRLQEQLFQSQKLEALGTLAGGIAHDFNNLLASIMGYASLAKADLSATDPIYHHVDVIETASQRASELTQQLLAFARGGKFDARPNDVNDIVREVVTLLSRTINKNITLVLNTCDDLLPAVCDAGQVQQAVLNICINARDAMPQGGTLTMETENSVLGPEDVRTLVDIRPGAFVRISISDTGVGMDRETKQHMFDPFFTTKEKGTGLGLSLVYGIIKKHRGFIQAYSEPGKGSMFRVHLPACEDAEECGKTEQAPAATAGSGTVLVVDDEPLIRSLARDILKRYGYEVIIAEGGAQAVEMYRQFGEQISVVLLDMVMPEMDGREVFRSIRELDPAAKIIVSSGYSHDRDADYLLEQGAAGFVQKPYRMVELANALSEVLAR